MHTDGRFIKDEYNRTIHFVGATEAQTAWGNPATYPYYRHEADPKPMAQRIKELSVKWVRLCVTYTYWIDPSTDSNGKSYKDWIDDYVREFTTRGIYCMVGCMGHEFASDLKNDNPTNWLNFLKELANRYISNPGMCGIYVFNEIHLSGMPVNEQRFYQLQAVQELHSINPHLLVVVTTDRAGNQGFDSWWLNQTQPNIVHSWHQYPWQDYYYADPPCPHAQAYADGNYTLARQLYESYLYDRFFKYSEEYDICMMCEEFGFNDNSTLKVGDKYWNPGWPQIQIDFMNFLEKYGHSWNQYCWWIYDGANYGLANVSDYYTLSPVGKILAQYLAT